MSDTDSIQTSPPNDMAAYETACRVIEDLVQNPGAFIKNLQFKLKYVVTAVAQMQKRIVTLSPYEDQCRSAMDEIDTVLLRLHETDQDNTDHGTKQGLVSRLKGLREESSALLSKFRMQEINLERTLHEPLQQASMRMVKLGESDPIVLQSADAISEAWKEVGKAWTGILEPLMEGVLGPVGKIQTLVDLINAQKKLSNPEEAFLMHLSRLYRLLRLAELTESMIHGALVPAEMNILLSEEQNPGYAAIMQGHMTQVGATIQEAKKLLGNNMSVA